jgi:hypothetical protein
MKAEPTGPLSAQDGQLMLEGNKLKFQRGAAAKTEGEDRNNRGENRHHVVTVRLAREILQCFSALWKFEQGQARKRRRREECSEQRKEKIACEPHFGIKSGAAYPISDQYPACTEILR